MKTLLIIAAILAVPVYAATRPDALPDDAAAAAYPTVSGTVDSLNDPLNPYPSVRVIPSPDSDTTATRNIDPSSITPRTSWRCPDTFPTTPPVSLRDYLHPGDPVAVVPALDTPYEGFFYSPSTNPQPGDTGSINVALVATGYWKPTDDPDPRYRDQLRDAANSAPSRDLRAACQDEYAADQAQEQQELRDIRDLARDDTSTSDDDSSSTYIPPTATTPNTNTNNGCPPGGCYNPNPCPPGGCQ